MSRPLSRIFAASMMSVAAAAIVGSALAQESTSGQPTAGAGSGELETVVVTAQKRAENLQKVPIAVSSISTSELTQKNVQSIKDLTTLVPNLAIVATFGNTNPQIVLRGVGAGSFNQTTEQTVALYMDEFVLSPASSKLSQLFDLDRVEVLRGPQGTLYGKNSTGGAINFITRAPDGTTEFDGTATVGRFGEYDFEAGAQAPITDNLSFRVAVLRRYRDGYGIDEFDNKPNNHIDDLAGRATLRYEDGGTDATLMIWGDRSKDTGAPEHDIAVEQAAFEGGVNPGKPIPSDINPLTGYKYNSNPDVDNTDVAEHSNTDNDGAVLKVTQDIGWGGVTLTDVTGALSSKANIVQDTDGSPIVLSDTNPYNETSREFSEELRLSSPADDRLTWIVGANYFYQLTHYVDANQFTFIGFPKVAWNGQDTSHSIAGFFDGTFHIDDQWSIVGGIRYTSDLKNWSEALTAPLPSGFLVGPYKESEHHSWAAPTYRIGLNYQMTPSTMFYVMYSKGYRSGAYDSGLKTSVSQFTPADPEYVANYEGGVKTTILDGHLRFALDGFYQQYTNQQNLIPNTLGICCAVVNAGNSEIYGGELEGTGVINDNFDVNVTADVTRGTYTNFNINGVNYTGAELANIPRYSVNISPEYRIPFRSGNFFLSPSFIFKGRSRIQVLPDGYSAENQPSYTLIDAQVGYRSDDGQWSIYGWVKNATDERIRTYYLAVPVYGWAFEVYNDPMMYGISTSVKF